MKGRSVGTVDEYIASQPAAAAEALEQVRKALRDALPRAEEVISYKMPAYRLNGEPVLYFAGWERHYSLYPAGGSLMAQFGAELAPYEVDKGTIRFPWSKPVPSKLIGRIARFRAKEVAQRNLQENRTGEERRAGR